MQPVSADSPLLAWEKAATAWITSSLEAYGEFRDAMSEAVFLNVYGSPWLQAAVGLGVPEAVPRHTERDLTRQAAQAELRARLEGRFEAGGLEEAALRALVYVRPDGVVD